MASKGNSKTRIVLSSGILTTMFLGAVSWAFTEVKKVRPIEVKIHYIEKTQDKIERQIDDIHKLLIRDNR